MLEDRAIAKFPSNGLIALDETLRNNRAQAVALGQGYAKGTLFAITNPEAALRITYEVFPQVRGTGRDEATALRDDIKTLEARIKNWKLEAGGVTKWGENSEANYQDYLDFLLKNGVLKQQAKAADLITNELIEDMNKFDQAEVINLAKTYKAP